MIYKNYLIEKDFNSIGNHKVFLFYGENHGLKSDLRNLIKINNKKKEILKMQQDEIISDNNILLNEIMNKSLFGEKKIIIIDKVGEKTLKIIEQIKDKIDDINIYLFAETLDKRSKLRSYFEKSNIFGISACYNDNELTIRKIIEKKLKTHAGLTNEIVNLIIDKTNLDRNKVNNEIEKINSYFYKKKLNIEELEILMNAKISDDFNLLKDEALKGNKINTNKLLDNTVFETENNILYLNVINQRIRKLYEINKLKIHNANIEIIIDQLKPPIFWKDKPNIINQTKKWNKQKIKRILEKTYQAEIELKSNSAIRRELLIKNLIIEICATANSA